MQSSRNVRLTTVATATMMISTAANAIVIGNRDGSERSNVNGQMHINLVEALASPVSVTEPGTLALLAGAALLGAAVTRRRNAASSPPYDALFRY